MNFRSFAAMGITIAAIMPFMALAIKSSSINLDRAQRGHQFIMPVLALLYCIPAIVIINRIAEGLIRLMEVLGRLVRLIPVWGEVISRLMSNICSFFHMGYGMQILCNTLLMASFCIFKRIALPYIEKYWSR